MTSLLNNQLNGSQKKVIETFSTFQTKTLKKHDNKLQDERFNLNTKTKNNNKNVTDKKQTISNFQLSNENFTQGKNHENNFFNFDILKDSTCLGTSGMTSRPFPTPMNCLGLDSSEFMDSSFLNKAIPPDSLKRVKLSPAEESIHIVPPKIFFDDLTPELLQSRVIPNQHLPSVRDNESIIYFRGANLDQQNKSFAGPKIFTSQILSPSKNYEKRRFNAMNVNRMLKLDLPEASFVRNISGATNGKSAEIHNQIVEEVALKNKSKGFVDCSPDEIFWNKHISSPHKEFIPKSKATSRASNFKK